METTLMVMKVLMKVRVDVKVTRKAYRTDDCQM